jgi:hypothetical protein
MSLEQLAFTTPERAAKSAADLRKMTAALLRAQAERLLATAKTIEQGGLPSPATDGDDLDNQALLDLAAAIKAFDRATSEIGVVVTVPLACAHLAKKHLGLHWEDTIYTGLAVEWIADLAEGEWGRVYNTGKVLGIERDHAAISEITAWKRGVGSGGQGIQIVKIADLRAKRPD